MTDYKKGKIYKIECQKTNRIYIGSTCQPTVAGRLRGHVRHARYHDKNTGAYSTTAYDIIADGDYKCLLVCNYPCNTKDELTAHESEWIKKYKNNPDYKCVNVCIPGRTKKEYRDDHREHFKQYRENVKDRLTEKHTCQCGGKYTTANKTTHEKTKKHMKWEATK